MASTKVRLSLRERGLCISCCGPNDNSPKHRCKKCTRRQYVRTRIPQVKAAISYYNKLLRRLQTEDRRWRRSKRKKHTSFKHKPSKWPERTIRGRTDD